MEVPLLKSRDLDSHKGTFGRPLIIGGSRGMSGAPALSGIGALRSGAGLVTVAIPDRCLEVVAAQHPCYMTVPLPDDTAGRISADAVQPLIELCNAATSIGIGPGMSQSDGVRAVVTSLYEQCTQPMVADADALNALANSPDGIPTPAGPRVMTPHVGEFRRLVGDNNLSPADCRNAARDFARQHQVIVVFKGHRTLVTDGTTDFENTTGNPGMATGGSGDVLTGIITALLSQQHTPLEATVLAVHIHGLAGDIARDAVGEISMTATDILAALPAAFKKVARDSEGRDKKMGF